MRVLGVDYGTKHIGIAAGDTETGMALKLRDIDVVSQGDALQKLRDIAARECAELVVFGLPLTFDFQETEMSREIRACGAQLAAAAKIHVAFINEVLSSDLANRFVKNKKKDHAESARIILQDYFDSSKQHAPR